MRARMTAVLCPLCGLRQGMPALAPGESAHCVRCRHELLSRSARGPLEPLAYTVAALALYAPAQLYPVLSMTYLGQYSENTIWSGVAEFARSGMWGLAILIFLVSILLPLVKLLAMLYLLLAARYGEVLHARLPGLRRFNTRLHLILERIGPWAMLDVFLVAVLVALVKVGEIARVEPGPGIVAFAALVVLTMLASARFDAASLWREGRGGAEAA